MNSFIEYLNRLGGDFLNFAAPMLWQSSLLIVILFAVDFLLRRKIRASIRYALWLVVLVKLCLPPALALPTGAAWWLFPRRAASKAPVFPKFVVTYDTAVPAASFVPQTFPAPPPPTVKLDVAGWALLASGAIGAVLLLSLTFRWWQISWKVRGAAESEEFTDTLEEVRRLAGWRPKLRLKLVEGRMSPAVCGLFHPVILLPRTLVEKLPAAQLRAVLLHELFHLRRKDVWVNCAQALLQILYWWHPLLWLANARIRRLREEAVDDAVMLALRDEAESYAPTLLEVAKQAFSHPLMSLGLVGIMESRSALRQRIERLVNFRAPRKAGLTLASLCGILFFSTVALPMGPSPASTNHPTALKAEEYVTQTGSGVSAATSIFSRTNASEEGLKAVRLVQEGKLLYEIGKFDAAETNLNNALTLDPDNTVALYYLNLIKQARYRRSALQHTVVGTQSGMAAGEKQWVQLMPQNPLWAPNAFALSNLTYTGPGREVIYTKLNRIWLNEVGPYDGLPLTEVVRQLNEAARQADPEKTGIRIIAPPILRDQKPADTNSIFITLPVALRWLTLGSALDAVTQSSSQAIKYSILDDGVVFSMRNTQELSVRAFRLDPQTVVYNLKQLGVDPVEQTNSPAALRKFFESLGVSFDSPPGKAVFFNDRLHSLFVKATASDLETIERALLALNTAPQIDIEARFCEVPEESLAELKSFLIQSNTFGGRLTGVLGVLTSDSARMAMRLLEVKPGFENLAKPECVTLSGRQAQMKATQIIVVTNFAFQEGWKNQEGTIVSNSLTPQTSKVETGPVLDVIPYVLSDGCTINLTVAPSLTKFLGYSESTNLTAVDNRPGERVDLPAVSPIFRVWQTSALVNMWDGQTVVLGSLPEKDFVNGKEVAGKSKSTDKELLVFITATLVDPAGNRIHTDDDIPFVRDGIPAQPIK